MLWICSSIRLGNKWKGVSYLKQLMRRFKNFYNNSNFIVKNLIRLALILTPIILVVELIFFRLEISIEKEYKIGQTRIQSIESLVGDRKLNGMNITNRLQTYTYSGAKNPSEDVEKYAELLVNKYGFEKIDYDDGKRLLKEEPENKSVVVIELKPFEDGYAVRIRKVENK